MKDTKANKTVKMVGGEARRMAIGCVANVMDILG